MIMYAVIFRAKVKKLDGQYSVMAKNMRDLAMSQYGCTEFTSCTEGDEEIAISYWPSLEHIKTWKNDADHLVAQSLGKEKWYETYTIQVVEIKREYSA